MRWLQLFGTVFFSFSSVYGQKAATVKISTTGCTAEVFCFPGRFDVYDLEDGSTVYASDCEQEGVSYGIYCVRLQKPIADLRSAEDTVIAYLDFLKLDFGIVKAAGYNKGHTLGKHENTRGVSDKWEDVDKHEWKIKGWTNGQFICIMHIHSDRELPDKKTEIFLNGIRFPGMK